MTKNILVVDDAPNVVLSVEFLLKQASYDVRTAGNGAEALLAIQERKPDLVLLDVMMPVRDGYDVCQAIKADPAMKDVRIIMLTAKGRPVEKEKGIALGADEYITKPFSTKELVEKVRIVLGDA